jgi:hypothetical protein
LQIQIQHLFALTKRVFFRTNEQFHGGDNATQQR